MRGTLDEEATNQNKYYQVRNSTKGQFLNNCLAIETRRSRVTASECGLVRSSTLFLVFATISRRSCSFSSLLFLLTFLLSSLYASSFIDTRFLRPPLNTTNQRPQTLFITRSNFCNSEKSETMGDREVSLFNIYGFTTSTTRIGPSYRPSSFKSDHAIQTIWEPVSHRTSERHCKVVVMDYTSFWEGTCTFFLRLHLV